MLTDEQVAHILTRVHFMPGWTFRVMGKDEIDGEYFVDTLDCPKVLIDPNPDSAQTDSVFDVPAAVTTEDEFLIAFRRALIERWEREVDAWIEYDGKLIFVQ